MSSSKKDFLQIRVECSAFSSADFSLYKLTGREVISQPFEFDIEIGGKAEFAFDGASVTGTDIALVFEHEGIEVRRVHGMVAEVSDMLAKLKDYRTYRLRIVPRALRLALVETSEITMNIAIPDIIKKKLELVGLSGGDVEQRLLGSYAPREFVVQYQEPDLAFVSRLAEHLGISYYFHHKSGKDVLVFTDNPDGFERAPEAIRYNDTGISRCVYQLQMHARIIPVMYVVRDYNYRQPLLDLTAEESAPTGYAGGIIEFGGHHKSPDEGKILAKARAEERQAQQLVYTGESSVPPLGAGVKFTLEEHPQLGSVELLAVEVEHYVNADQPDPLVAAQDLHYANKFRAIPGAQNYRPPRVTKKPQVAGLVTGVVDTGPGGSTEYAQIDDQGRYMVRLYFDTAATGGGMVSRPIRMLQNHAGANYGTHFPLKPGVEVLVGFVNGDPDRPVIVGAAPNPLTPSPVAVGNRTTHRIKTKAGILIDLVDE
ncbi:type VI secretion system Vgr family protein [Chondromyces apiculatus]|uniref:VgrG protein n=1 Tax=Chondromyces apiculatus DSM 436 TaxID=1192034 RepID=A0A017T2T0_9BACT|nr:type VI secretion system tip protein TssI/VgrG [Chondromyces apiculatus]EYF03145.1 VgrG protein [Chondromyces apiculatus DSM 436]